MAGDFLSCPWKLSWKLLSQKGCFPFQKRNKYIIFETEQSRRIAHKIADCRYIAEKLNGAGKRFDPRYLLHINAELSAFFIFRGKFRGK